MIASQICNSCSVSKSLSLFGPDKRMNSGRKGNCRPCEAEKHRTWYAANKEKVAAYVKKLRAKFKEKIREEKRKYRERNRERLCAKDRARHYANRDERNVADRARYVAKADELRSQKRAFYEANKERLLKRMRTWRENNKHLVAATGAQRRAKKLLATPKWANKFFIDEVYHLARVRTKVTGIKWHVDHIVPLQGRTVCGLHVENNLQVIPAAVNIAKHARWWPDMPLEIRA